MDYGAYIIDDAAWSAYYFCTEWGPNGRVLDEFSSRWGFGFGQQTPAGTGNNSPTSMAGKWGKDMQTVFTSLCVVTNNSATSVGGGGNSRRQPLAPDFTTGVRAEGTLLAQNSRTAACSAAGAFIDLRGRLCAAASSGIHFAETSRGARVSRVALLP
jgi:hypothetical protein